ncbi:MAG: bifunctional (p)ppGpp synthetase/guanosine-3',5'-bis(diphosphate) 3'-pyrophosphohydrolase [Proteobacteria bacterium]|nr:bifunctional (p)ppGpp synthetase/guanosine-3',5'-bis(diphosphate) 3'-pyrophosphohydrolase [Pseudomonadota bacterium]
MIRIETIISRFQEYSEEQVNCSPLQKAYILLAREQFHSNSSTIQFSLEIAQVLTGLRLDIQSLVSGLLSGLFMEGEISIEEIAEKMGKETANILMHLQTVNPASVKKDEDVRVAENMRNMIFATSKDIRILFVNLAIRLVQMRHCRDLYGDHCVKFSEETLATFAPIAERLGLAHIKIELEDLSLANLHPEAFKRIDDFCSQRKDKHHQVLKKLQTDISGMIRNNGLQGEVKGRIKHYYSIFRKGIKDQVDYEHIHDLIGIRIITEKIGDCYKILGLVHNGYQPVIERYKDYISYPKPNGYQSLHTMVYTNDGYGFELQVRTGKMDEIAEHGFASHWTYKVDNIPQSNSENIAWIQDLSDSLNITSDPRESLEIFTRELYSDFVYVFTPSGKIFKLPRGSSVLDFAFQIHTDIGMHCSGALINGRTCSSNTVLNHGDKVEVLTSEDQEPSVDWLQYSKTTRALSPIRYFLRKKEKQEAEKFGAELFSELLVKLGIKAEEFENSTAWKEFLKAENFKNKVDYFKDLGIGKSNIQKLHGLLTEPELPKKESFKTRLTLPFKKKQVGIKIAGMESSMIQYAHCCNPLHGDLIVGVVTRGEGVTIHWENCRIIQTQQINPDRLVDVEWAKEQLEKLPVRIHIQFDNRIRTNLLVIKVLDQAKIVVVENSLKLVQNTNYQDILMKIESSSQLDKIIKRLNALDSVKAYRKQETELVDSAG